MLLQLLLLGVATGLRIAADYSDSRLGGSGGVTPESRLQSKTHELGTPCRSSTNPSAPPCSPNVLFLMTDQWNYPMSYETEEIKNWRTTYLKGETQLRQNGFELHRHYVASIACAPSRASLFTGHYPSLHGVSQTDGISKPLNDPRRWPLNPGTVPTMGNWFRAADYQTYYKGKWHVADSDIYLPGSRTALHSYNERGVPLPDVERLYHNRLEDFGFSEWVGPEPHGASPYNSGSCAPCNGSACYSGRDDVYTEDIIDLLGRLNGTYNSPFFLVGSILGVHDIALYGDVTKNLAMYNFTIDSSVPVIPPAPTANENLMTKPLCQNDWKTKWHQAVQPTSDTDGFRRFYYSLALKQDTLLKKILDALATTVFADNTIVVWTSDHGEYLGAHGLRQKWFSGYEEVTHVPCLFQLPSSLKSANSPKGTQILSSHVDMLPTLLGLTGLNQDELRAKLVLTHSEAQPLVGKDLSSVIKGASTTLPVNTNPVIFLQIEDQILTGSNQISQVTKQPYSSVIQPASIQMVLAYVGASLYKYVRYYDNVQWWTNPGSVPPFDNNEGSYKFTPAPDQYELYDVTGDSTEVSNLYHLRNVNLEVNTTLKIMTQHLTNQCNAKRLKPQHVEPNYPAGWMPCV